MFCKISTFVSLCFSTSECRKTRAFILVLLENETMRMEVWSIQTRPDPTRTKLYLLNRFCHPEETTKGCLGDLVAPDGSTGIGNSDGDGLTTTTRMRRPALVLMAMKLNNRTDTHTLRWTTVRVGVPSLVQVEGIWKRKNFSFRGRVKRSSD